MTRYLNKEWGLGPSPEDESPTYEVEVGGEKTHCVGHGALLYLLSHHREQPVTVTRTDWPSLIFHYIEEHAIHAAVALRDTGEVGING